MMRHAREGCLVWLGGEQIQPAINLKCVRTDDLPVTILCEIGGQVRFSNRGGTQEEERGGGR